MITRKLRLQHGWSQDQLAEMSGLSTRTIQRIERGQVPSVESAKSLAAVFNIDFNDLIEDDTMSTEQTTTTRLDVSEPAVKEPVSHAELSEAEAEAIEYVRDIKHFYMNLACYLVVIPMLAVIDLTHSPERLWFYWPAFGWGIGLLMHGLNVFEVFNWFSPGWERKRIEKRLGRKL